MTDSIHASADNLGYDPYDSSSTRNARIDLIDPPATLPIANIDSKREQARLVLARARRALGHDLCGHSITDLLADNFPWKLDECRAIALEIA
jgi:hypothetical protein